jgi:hypothetical protein
MSKVTAHTELPKDAEAVSAEAVKAEVKSVAQPAYKAWTPIEFKLPDGRAIVMQEPRLLTRLQNQIMKDTFLADPRLLTSELTTVQALLFIHSINGVITSKPQDSLERDALEQEIGVRNMSLIVRAFQDHFPDFDQEALQVTKK